METAMSEGNRESSDHVEPTPPSSSALRQRRATLHMRKRGRSRRPSVLHEELERIQAQIEADELTFDDILPDGHAGDRDEVNDSQQEGRKPQGEDKTNKTKSSEVSRPSVGGRLSSRASQKLSDSGKLEDQINLQHLVELMRVFNEADENGSDGLEMDEFKMAFGQILGKGKNDHQMAIMFMKIDTNCDGTVDWDEFCTYMLLEYRERDVMAGEALPPYPNPVKVLHSLHRDTISRIAFLPNFNRRTQDNCHSTPTHPSDTGDSKHEIDGRYLSVCRDGTLCFWKNDFTLQKTVHLDTNKRNLTWVTDMAIMPNVNKVVLSFTNNLMSIYDLATSSAESLFHIVALPACVLVMDYWFDPNEANRAVLVMGDSSGAVIVMEFFSATNTLFGIRTSKQVDNIRVSFMELLHHKPNGMTVTYIPKVHGDWVCKVKYCPSMEYFMSCSGDSNSALYRGDLRGIQEGSRFKVRKGVATFDYCEDWNIIATGGLDRGVRIWNPYVTCKPVAVLKGHIATILHVAINTSTGQILSFSKDMELRVWDIQEQLCLQTCHRFQPLAPQLPSAFFLHPASGVVLIGTNHLGVLEPLHDDDMHGTRGEIFSHEKPLCAALYNVHFNQIVSGCHGSQVNVWDVDTGEKTIQFSKCHGEQEITAMAFDTTGRRLITGGRDGFLKIWNFNNGANLSVLDSKYNVEVTCINFVKQSIFVGGWSKLLAVYRDTKEEYNIVEPTFFGIGQHTDDILCMDYQEPNTLVSGSFDGDIVVWNIDAERMMHKMNANTYSRRRTESGRTRSSPQSATRRTNTPRGAAMNRSFEVNKQTATDPRSVEKVVFLQTRDSSDEDTANLVACGAGGWVDFWNIQGGGLLGEFNALDSLRGGDKLERKVKQLETITALKTDSKDTLLATGNTMGYIQLWDIEEYCVHVPIDERPIVSAPPLRVTWRGHFGSIVSLELAEDKGLLITASTDCCVRLWTVTGRFIGTFGEKNRWHLTYPIIDSELPRKVPQGINRVCSFWTTQVVGGSTKSKWKRAKNVLHVLRCKNMFSDTDSVVDLDDWSQPEFDYTGKKNLLGKYYERKTRFRNPTVPVKLRLADGGRICGVYNVLKCSDIHEPQVCQKIITSGSPICKTGKDTVNVQEITEQESEVTNAPKFEHTEASLLPMLAPCLGKT